MRKWVDQALLLGFLAVGVVVGVCARRTPGPGQHCGCAAINCTEPCSSCCSPVSCRGMQGFTPYDQGFETLPRDGPEDEPRDPIWAPPR